VRLANIRSINGYAVLMTGKISMFGSLGQRGLAGDREARASQRRRPIRHVFVALRVADAIHERPGVLLDWVQEPQGWIARVAYVADEEGTLVVAWFAAEQLTPVPDVGTVPGAAGSPG